MDDKGTAMSVWQPIETAPSFGRVIIGWLSPDDPDYWDDLDIAEDISEDSYVNGNGNLVRRKEGRYWPTHWAPIPSLKP